MSYDIGQWNNQPLYNCRQCPYDTLDEQEMLRHQETHRAPPPPVEVEVLRLDRFGNVVGTETVTVTAPTPAPAELKRPSKAKRTEEKQEVGDGESNAG